MLINNIKFDQLISTQLIVIIYFILY